MSKAARIRQLYEAGKSTREIADEVGCRIEYVRVCARQRTDGGMSAAETRYAINRFGSLQAYRRHCNTRDSARKARKDYRKRRYASDPVFRAKMIARVVVWKRNRYATDPAYRAKEKARKAAWHQRKRLAQEASA